jgi:hypothetical protein
VVDPDPVGWRRVAAPVLGEGELVAGEQVGDQAVHALPADAAHWHRRQPRVVRVDPLLCLSGRRRFH